MRSDNNLIQQLKERPILFKSEMVRAILDGRKTQTRRVVMLTMNDTGVPWTLVHADENGAQFDCRSVSEYVKNPYGKVGDKIWVRETFSQWSDEATKYAVRSKDVAVYRADYRAGTSPLEIGGQEKWKSPIFMPRSASRITLEITGVRVERLQDITEEDAQAEGASWPTVLTFGKSHGYRQSFQALWESINGKGSWAQNPFVCVIAFKKL